jgi:hypothetical protein
LFSWGALSRASSVLMTLRQPMGAVGFFKRLSRVCRSRGSSVSIVSDYALDDWGSIPGGGQRIFPPSSVSRPALRPTQPPVQWVLGVLPRGKARPGVTLTIHPHLVPRSRMDRSYTSSPPSASMACSGTALLCFVICTWLSDSTAHSI